MHPLNQNDQNHQSHSTQFELAKVPQKRGRRPKVEKGLPDLQSRQDIARTYLEEQLKHWPDLASQGVIPAVNDDNVALLAEDMARSYLDLEEKYTPAFIQTLPVSLILAVAYLRFSDPNSNPRSLDQQLRNILRRARQEGHFIPWSLICADSAVTGRVACRRGYQMANNYLSRSTSRLKCFYIDDTGRMSRNLIESLMLFRLIQQRGLRFVGVSDGVDSANEDSKLHFTIKASFNEQFSEQLSKKVRRGREDAFFENKNGGPPSFSYKLQPRLDHNGQLIISKKGKAEQHKVINQEIADEIVKVSKRIVHESLTPDQALRDLNQRRIGGKSNWFRSTFIQMLKNHCHIGIEYGNMSRQVIDPDTGKRTIIKNPPEQWWRRDVPEFRIMEDELFLAY